MASSVHDRTPEHPPDDRAPGAPQDTVDDGPLHGAPLRPLQDVHLNLPSRHSASRPAFVRPPTPYNPDFEDTYYLPPPAVSSLPAIPKLSGPNYRSWVTNVELVLRRHQEWSFVQDVPPSPNARSHAWDEKDLLARSEIMWSCDPDVQCLLSRCTTAKDCWDTLRREFTVRDYIEIHQMVDDFNWVSKLPNESCKQFIDRVRLLAEELATSGRPIANEDVAYRMLFRLPEEYRQLRTSIISNRSDDHKLSTARIIPAILSEERHFINTSRSRAAPAVPSSTSASNASFTSTSQLSPDFNQPDSQHGQRYTSSRRRSDRSDYRYNRDRSRSPRNDRNRNDRDRQDRDDRRQDREDRPPACNFCLGYNHRQENCFLKFPEKHPNHPVNRRPRSPNNIPLQKASPSETKPTPVAETSNHVQVHSASPPEDTKLRFEYSYYSGPPGIGNGRLDWMLDSGTTSHFVKWKDQFQSFSVQEPPIHIDTAAGPSSLTGFAIGDVPLSVASGSVLLRNVVYTPGLHTNCNLLSMTALDSEGFSVTFSNQKAFITRRSDNLLWATGSLRSNLYFLDTVPRPSAYSLAPSLIDTQILETWHKRLGHLSARNIQHLQRISNGIKIGSPPTLERNADCVDCLKSAQHRLPSHVPTRGALRKLQIVHCDTCGPMKMLAIGGKELYFLVFVDDFTRMLWVYGLTAKSAAFEAFQHLVVHTERECGENFLTLRSDNAGEFISAKMKDWCSERGIILQTTQPYTPDMNGVAERVIRTTVEHASAMLWSSFLGLGFWYEAVKTAVYLKNRSPHSAREKTPYELWTGTVPSLAHLRVFGCRCYALVPDKKRS